LSSRSFTRRQILSLSIYKPPHPFIVLDCQQIKVLFEQEFSQRYHVQLSGGAEEPLYLVAQPGQTLNQLIYTRDYAASALHEIAHWCLASDAQLKLKDWGHWYVPDGRNAEQQRTFQRAEARVQAIEWMLSVAAGRPFRESSDNLSGESIDDTWFKDQIHQQVRRFCEQGFPERAEQLFNVFTKARKQVLTLTATLFQRQLLDI